MNPKALAVLSWAGLSVYVLFRDWGKDQPKALQELVGIWLLSVGSLALSELSPELGLLSTLFLVADVLIEPGQVNAGQSFAQTVAKVLPSSSSTQGKVVV